MANGRYSSGRSRHRRDDTEVTASLRRGSSVANNSRDDNDGDRAQLTKQKRVLQNPRRNEARRMSLTNRGAVGCKLSLKEAFNQQFAAHFGLPKELDAPLSESTVRCINRDIRVEIYFVKGFPRGCLTWTDLLREYPVFLCNLRSKIEKKWDLLQMCNGQWGIDWAIQRTLGRDRVKPDANENQNEGGDTRNRLDSNPMMRSIERGSNRSLSRANYRSTNDANPNIGSDSGNDTPDNSQNVASRRNAVRPGGKRHRIIHNEIDEPNGRELDRLRRRRLVFSDDEVDSESAHERSPPRRSSISQGKRRAESGGPHRGPSRKRRRTAQ